MLVKWLIYKSYGLRSRFILQAMGAIERLKPAPRGQASMRRFILQAMGAIESIGGKDVDTKNDWVASSFKPWERLKGARQGSAMRNQKVASSFKPWERLKDSMLQFLIRLLLGVASSFKPWEREKIN